MSAVQAWCDLAGIDSKNITKEETILFEAEIFACLCEEIKEIFREQYKEFFRLMKYTVEMEKDMLETNFLRLVINDILSTEEYDLKGIAHYTDTHEDIVEEVVCGINCNPSALFLQRVIALHRSVRRDLYQVVIRKIVADYHSAA